MVKFREEKIERFVDFNLSSRFCRYYSELRFEYFCVQYSVPFAVYFFFLLLFSTISRTINVLTRFETIAGLKLTLQTKRRANVSGDDTKKRTKKEDGSADDEEDDDISIGNIRGGVRNLRILFSLNSNDFSNEIQETKQETKVYSDCLQFK